MTNRTIHWARRRGALFPLVAGLALLAACALPPRITGTTHDVEIVLVDGCPTSVNPPDGICDGIPDTDDQTVCLRIGDAVRWETSTRVPFNVYLDPFGKAWTSTPWYAPKRRQFTRGPMRRRELEGKELKFKYTVRVGECTPLDPWIVVHY